MCSSFLFVQLVLYWIARFFSNRVDKALSPVRVFDCKIENAVVVDLQELREIFRMRRYLLPLILVGVNCIGIFLPTRRLDRTKHRQYHNRGVTLAVV